MKNKLKIFSLLFLSVLASHLFAEIPFNIGMKIRATEKAAEIKALDNVDCLIKYNQLDSLNLVDDRFSGGGKIYFDKTNWIWLNNDQLKLFKPDGTYLGQCSIDSKSLMNSKYAIWKNTSAYSSNLICLKNLRKTSIHYNTKWEYQPCKKSELEYITFPDSLAQNQYVVDSSFNNFTSITIRNSISKECFQVFQNPKDLTIHYFARYSCFDSLRQAIKLGDIVQ